MSNEPVSAEAMTYADKLFPCTNPCDSFGICEGCYERNIFLAGYNFGYRAISAQLKLATDALEYMGNCLGFCPNHLGADSYKDPGVKMAQEIIEAMRNHARQELKKIQEMGKC